MGATAHAAGEAERRGSGSHPRGQSARADRAGAYGGRDRWRERGGGAIINIASSAARRMPPGEAIYAAAKAGLIAFTHAAFAELRDRGIKLSVIIPGLIDTALIPHEQAARPRADAAARRRRRCRHDNRQRAGARLPSRGGAGAAARSAAQDQLTDAQIPQTRPSFTLRFAIALVAGLAAAVMISPFAAAAVAALGLRFPFPRIFDRTVMVTLLAAMLIGSRSMEFCRIDARGLRRPRSKSASMR